MKQLIYICGVILFLVSCHKSEEELPTTQEEKPQKEVDYRTFSFKNLYDLVKNPISLESFKKQLDQQKIAYFPLDYDQDIYFIAELENAPYKYFRVEVESGTVLINFDKPTAKDLRRGFIQNIKIYPLDDNKKFIGKFQYQEKEKYKFIFDMVKNTFDEKSPYTTEFNSIQVPFPRRDIQYDEFIEELSYYNDGNALWYTTVGRIPLEECSPEKNVPKIEVLYGPNETLGNLPHTSVYEIKIDANLPSDLRNLIYNN